MTTPTKIYILNLTLAALQQGPINDWVNGPAKITALSDLYDNFKMSALQKANWSFALKTQQLSQLSAVSDYPNYKYMYQIPNDCVSIWQLYAGAYQTQSDYQKIGERIYSNQSRLFLLYIFPQTENNWPGSFIDYFYKQLASDACMMFTQDKTLQEVLIKQAAFAFSEATSFDGQQHPSYQITNFPSIMARLSS